MLNSLSINGHMVSFEEHNPIALHQGLTLITGKNGRGKSTVLEMIRYALFGSRALRRPMSDYKGLSVVLDFTLKGVGYKVTRSSALTLLATADGTNLATGTTPVNQAVTNLFGYGLAVFDIANCCGQNQVMLFSDRMQPGDRKKLIDQTVGLSAIDDLAAELNAEALAIGKEITFLDQRLGEAPPQEPPRPVPFRDLENLRADCSKAQGAWAQAQVIRSTLSRLDLTPPVAPTPVDLPAGFNPEAVQQEIAGLRVRQTRRSFLLGTVNQRPVPPGAPVNPDITFSDEELTAKISDAQTHKILNQQLAALDLPALSLEQIDEAAAGLSLWNDFQAARKLREQGDAECPACGHHFPNAHKALEHYAHVPAEMERPSLTSDYLHRQRLLHENIQKGETLKAALISLEPLMPEAEQLRTHLRSYQTQLEAYNTQATQYQAALESFQTAESELSEIPDCSGLITSLEKGLEAHRCYTAAIEKFEQAKIKHAEAVAEHARLTEELVAVDSESQKLTGLQQLLEEHLTYQEAYKAYTKRLGDWNADSDKLRELTAQRDDLKAGKSALTDLKVRIKSYLLPSLNSVSSQLLFEMTGGELSEVKLDEDFEILVDGKPIAAMSGSEQAVANLAIRLGLGQILTNRVFSVFMGDELDASMDEDRAAYLMECLRRLRGSISQILLVTHKQFEADNTISLMRRK